MSYIILINHWWWLIRRTGGLGGGAPSGKAVGLHTGALGEGEGKILIFLLYFPGIHSQEPGEDGCKSVAFTSRKGQQFVLSSGTGVV